MEAMNIRYIDININATPSKVYEFTANPENLPRWASGLSGAVIKKVKEDWIADSPMGKVKIQFVAKNSLGVLDHDVTLENGKKFNNPLRVISNLEGSTVTFVLFRQKEMTDQEFAKDADTIKKDLTKLKAILEVKN